MKLFTVTLLTTLVSLQSLAGAIPAGRYEGDAIWKSSSAEGHYKVSAVIEEGKFFTQYNLPDGSVKHWNFESVENKKGFFKVTAHGETIGEGYCLENVEVCHYEVKVGNFSLEETLTVQSGKLYRFGSKGDVSGRIVWQEMLVKK